MSDLVLGLDIGPTSLGWALFSKDTLIDCGVRIFPEGVDRDQQGGEKSKSQSRRVARGIRRQVRRRAQRMRQLKDALIKAGLFPADLEAQTEILATDPYELRAKALLEELTPHEIGRVLLHLAKRRGFLSNRTTDRGGGSELKGILAAMTQLQAEIAERGCETLGQYLHQLGVSDEDALPRLRGRHTLRAMYEDEFDKIWERQSSFHAELLTEALRYGSEGKKSYPLIPEARRKEETLLKRFGLHGLIFFQRKMYWPKSMIGRCDLEPKEKRCAKADRLAQRFRILQEVNNLRLFSPADRKEYSFVELVGADADKKLVAYLSEAKERTFPQIRKKFGLPESVAFNYERGERSKLKGHETDALFNGKNGLGKKRWNNIADDVKDEIIRIVLEEDREDVAIEKLTNQCGLTSDEAAIAIALHLPAGYSNYSRVAIRNLLPHLEAGMPLMGNDASDSALHAAGYLRPDEREVRQYEKLPEPPEVPNPLVRQALYEVRKVVNALIRVHGRLGTIRVELAREAKKSAEERTQIRIANAKRERENAAIAKTLQELKPPVRSTRRNIQRYLLWQEQGGVCIYTGKAISQAQLFDSGEVDVDHILPRWRSLDDSMANKVIAHRTANNEKGDKTPWEWLGHDKSRFDELLLRAQRLSYGKRQRFVQEHVELSEFVERQLRDTTYISRLVVQYLKGLGVPITTVKGPMTAELRHQWGLNALLNADGSQRKNRADHRHHAIDAVVVGLTDAKRLHALAKARGRDMEFPWPKFRSDVADALGRLKVSHRVRRRIQGALHEATIYGATQKAETPRPQADRPWAKGWVEDPQVVVRRKAVTDLTNTKHLEKVRDVTIRRILQDHLRQRQIDPTKPGAIPKDAFSGENAPQMPSGTPIKKVRMVEEGQTFRPLREGDRLQLTKPGSNHHISYFAVEEKGEEVWKGSVTVMWDAARRAKDAEACGNMVARDDGAEGRFVMSLSIGEMFEMTQDDGEIILCVVRKIDQRSKRVYYKRHTDARPVAEINKDNLYLTPKNLQQREARKVTATPLGQIRDAND
ncbi:CRISPR-associated endonuclease Cas9 [Blastopirellula retiformator]|uniref:CRISPR-associated endonuclease Cas9 n=2 Tax=Blastopirellula retiformator TaxID=2527970 RepID=A0A5C5UV76_9BACT|nr:CRISPR-associated endonuclease Cas9 [Blastopirellula retiformator]